MDSHKLLRLSDPPLEVIADLLVRQPDDPVGKRGSPSLQQDKEVRQHASGIAVEGLAVRGVDDVRDPSHPRREPPNDSRLRCMGVDEIEPSLPEEPVNLQEGHQVLYRRGAPDQVGDLCHLNLWLEPAGELRDVPRSPVDQALPEERGEARHCEQSVRGRPPSVQASDKVENSHCPPPGASYRSLAIPILTYCRCWIMSDS